MASDGRGKTRNKKNDDVALKPYDRPKSLLSRFGDTLKDLLSLSRHQESFSGRPSNPVNVEETVDVEGATMQTNEHQTSEDSGFNSRTTADGVVLECGGYQATFDHQYDLGGQTAAEITPLVRPSSSLSMQSAGQSAPGFGFMKRPSTLRDSHESCLPRLSFIGRSSDFQPSSSRDSPGICSSDVSFAGKRVAPSPSYDDSSSEISESREKFETPLKRQRMERTFAPFVATSEIHDEVNRSRLAQKPTDRSFLWSSRFNSPALGHRETTGKKPRFDLDSFESTLRNTDASLLSSNHRQSPYYHGKTTYGGASARQKLFKHLDAQHKVVPTVRQKVQVEPTPFATSRAAVLSATSRKILQGLEEHESNRRPESDLVSSFRSSVAGSPLCFMPRLTSRHNGLEVSGQSLPVKNRPPVHDLPAPTLAVIRNSVRAFQNSAGDEAIKKAAETSSKPTAAGVSRSSTEVTAPGIQLSAAQSSRATGKMRREPTRRHYTAVVVGNEEDREEMESDLELSTIKLPVTNLKPLVTIISSSSTTGSSNSSVSDVKAEFPMKSPFTFSLPISVCNSGGVAADSEPKNFQFRSPIAIDDRLTSSSVEVDPVASSSSSASLSQSSLAMSFDLRSAVRKAQPSLPSSSSSEFNCFVPAKELKQGSIMDVLGGSKNSSTKTTDVLSPGLASATSEAVVTSESDKRPLSELFKSNKDKWSCRECLVDNSNDDSKCVCCDALRPQSQSLASQSVPPPNYSLSSSASSVAKLPLSELFKAPVGQWTCSSCSVSNDASVSCCPCCLTRKPVSSVTAAMATSTKANEGKASEPEKRAEVMSSSTDPCSLASQFKKKPGEWTCEQCFVSNSAGSTSCVACEEPKPGAMQQSPPTNSNNNNRLTSATTSDHAITTVGNGFKLNADALWNVGQSTCSTSASDVSSVTIAPTGGFKLNIPTGGFSGFSFSTSSQLTNNKDVSFSTTGGFKPPSGFTGFGTTKFGISNGENEEPKATSIAVTTTTLTSPEKPIAVPSSSVSENSSVNSLGNGDFCVNSIHDNDSKAKLISSGFVINSSNSGLLSNNASMPSAVHFGINNANIQHPPHEGKVEKDDSSRNPDLVRDAVLKPCVIVTSSSSGSCDSTNAPSFSFSASKFSFGTVDSTQPKSNAPGVSSAQVGFGSVLPAALPSTASLQTTSFSLITVTAAQTGIFSRPTTTTTTIEKAVEPLKSNLFTFGQNTMNIQNVEASVFKFGQNASNTSDVIAPSFKFEENPSFNTSNVGLTFKFGQNQPLQEEKSSANNKNLFVFGKPQNTTSNSVFQFGAGSSALAPSAGAFGSGSNQTAAVPAFGQQSAAPVASFSFGAPKFTFGVSSSGARPATAVGTPALQGTKRPMTDDHSLTKLGRVSTEEVQMQDEPAASGRFTFNSPSTGFGFGNQQPTAPPRPVFFGQRQVNPASAFQMSAPAPSLPPSFSFSGQQQATVLPAFGAQNVANGVVSTGPTTAFGTNTAAVPLASNFNFSSTPNFNFTQTLSDQPTFNAQPSASQMPGRVFKKAVRRTQKH